MDATWDDPSHPTNTNPTSISDASKISEGFVPYYQALFNRKYPVQSALDTCMATLCDPSRPKVLLPTATACGAAVSPKEVLDGAASLPLGKSPGPDCLPNDFYKTFRKKLTPILTAVFNFAHEQGHLPKEMTHGLISVLYKKKDRKDPRNYRPITLLNGDYKILMRILTARLKKAASQFVSEQQNGFVPGGFIVENILLLQLIQEYVEEENLEALFIFLDFEKAFDRCSWAYLTEAIKALGFPDSTPSAPGSPTTQPHPFLKWVQLAYSHDHPPTRCMHINGYLSSPFALNSGVAQGCPLSPLLFLFITEALTRLITNDSRIQGINIDGLHYRISQYADDSTLIATPSDIPYFNEDLQIYLDATGMRENRLKREGKPSYYRQIST